MTLTDEQLAAAKALVEAATPGPWEADIDSRMGTVDGIQRVRPNGWIESIIAASSAKVVAIADAEFIASSRTLLPELIAEVERLRAENEEQRHTLDMYRRNFNRQADKVWNGR